MDDMTATKKKMTTSTRRKKPATARKISNKRVIEGLDRGRPSTCPSCGRPVGIRSKACPACGTALDPSAIRRA